jgi:glucosamine-6-phosphate deaminase
LLNTIKSNKKRAALQHHVSQLTLSVFDNYGNNLEQRANFTHEFYQIVSKETIISLPQPLPSLRRRTIFCNNPAKRAAEDIVRCIRHKPNSVFLLPTGNTPIPMYQSLVEYFRQGLVNFSKTTTFNLDEYVHSKEYYDFMQQHLFQHINTKSNRTHFLNGYSKDLNKECTRYETLIQKNTIDLAILGIGSNGHIAFNEPTTNLDTTSKTRIVHLSEDTRLQNSTKHTHALTVGIQTILSAKKIILLANTNKFSIIKRLFSNECIPALALQYHPNVELYLQTDMENNL